MRAAAGLGCLLAATPVWAGGFEVPDLGTVPLGRGSAFTARADSLDAFHYNPAGLAKLPGPNLLVGSNVVNLNTEFRRRGSGDMVVPSDNDGVAVPDPAVDPNTGEPFAPVRNGKRFGPAPTLVFSWGDVGVRGLALHFGVLPASGFGGHDWPTRGAQRYTVRQGDFLFLSVGAGISYRLNRYFAIGANFLSGMFVSEFNTATRRGAAGTAMNEAHGEDNDVTIRAKDLFVPSANFGVLSQPLSWLELGLAVRLPYTTKAEGTLRYRGGEATPDARLASASRVTVRQQFPTVIRSGLRFIHPRFDIETDFVWENYARVDEIEVAFSNPNADFAPSDVLPVSEYTDPRLLYLDAFGNGSAFLPVIATDVPLHFRDTYSVRLGSDIEVWPQHLTLRAGGWWQSSAYPQDRRTFTVRFPFDQQFAVTAGLTGHIREIVHISVGYAHVFQPPVRVTEGIVQANAFREPDDPVKRGNIVNNGEYRANLNIFGVAVETHFDPLMRRKP
jgi:long-subunit fatty acid transport protein